MLKYTMTDRFEYSQPSGNEGTPSRSFRSIHRLTVGALVLLLWIPTLAGYDPDPEALLGMHYPDTRGLVHIVLQGLDLWSEDAEELVIRTGAVESAFLHREGISGGPELGFWQIHPRTAKHLLFTYLLRPSKSDMRDKFERLLGYDLTILQEEERFESELRDNDILGIALCRLWYFIAPYPVQDATDHWAQAWLWKKWYNTSKGKGSTGQFVRAARRINV